MSDLLRENLDIVFCGTAKGKKSAETNAYYAGRGNKFWDVLKEAGFTAQKLAPAAYRELLSCGIGLTDLNQVESGMDRHISAEKCDIDGFKKKMAKYNPKAIAFTSIEAAKIYFKRSAVRCGEQPEKLGNSRIFVLPSTSGANNGGWKRERDHWYGLRAAL